MPERVLHTVTYMGRGGLETMLMNYYRAVDRERIRFDFLVHRDFKAEYDDEILSLGGNIYRLPRLDPFSVKYRRALRDFFATHSYKIVHSHLDCMSALPLSAARAAGVPVRIAHAHNSLQNKDIKYPIKLISKRFIPHNATHFLACGRAAGEWMFSCHRFDILPNAIDTATFAYSEEKRHRIRSALSLGDAPVVGHVARLRSQKNHDFSLRVFKALLELRPNARLLLVGDGECEENIRRTAHELELGNSVLFLGSRADVPDILSAIDAFVLTSLYEGLPVSVIEAQATGLPCILSDNVSHECALCDNVEFVSLDCSPAHWASRINAHLDEKRLDRSARICECGYDIATNAERLQGFYLSGGDTQWLV